MGRNKVSVQARINAAISNRATRLSLRGAVSAAQIATIGEMDWLEELDLGHTQLPRSLQPLTALRGLRQLDFSGVLLPAALHKQLLPHLGKLEVLIAHDLLAPTEMLRVLAAMPRLRDLIGLRVAPSRRNIGILATMPSLSRLRLDGALSPRVLARLPELAQLQHLCLSGEGLTDLASLAAMPSLRLLELHDNPPLRSWKSLASLRGLRGLHARRFGRAGMRYAARLPELALLTYEDRGSADAALEWIPRMPALRHLGITGARGTTDAGMAHLRGVPLRSLCLSDFRGITDAGIAHLEGMRGLERLWLGCAGWAGVTDRGLAFLRNMTEMRVLDINHVGLSDVGVGFLRSMPALSFLDLTGNTISAASLSGLPCLPALRYLRLVCVPVGDGMLPVLRQCSRLEALYFNKNGFSPSVMSQIQALQARINLSQYHWPPWRAVEVSLLEA